jgi:hypothetical protein
MPHLTNPSSALVMATDLIRNANVSIISLATRHVEWLLGEIPSELDTPFMMDSRVHHGRMIANTQVTSLGSPSATEATMVLKSEYEGQKTDFSSLDSVELRLEQQDTTDYWLEQIFYKAPALRALRLLISPPCTSSLTARMVVPALAEFELSRLSTSAEQIVAMLACSRGTLTKLSLRSITLAEGSTWNELLSLIAKEFASLTSFNVRFLSQTGGLGRVDFRKVPEHVPEESRAGLEFREKAPEKRVTGMAYDGPNAAEILSVLGSHVYLQTWAHIEERRARANAESSGLVSTA